MTLHKKKRTKIACDKFLANAAALYRFYLMILEVFTNLNDFVIL